MCLVLCTVLVFTFTSSLGRRLYITHLQTMYEGSDTESPPTETLNGSVQQCPASCLGAAATRKFVAFVSQSRYMPLPQ